MNLKNIAFGLMLALSPCLALAGAEPIRGPFKVLPQQCRGLEHAEYVRGLDSVLSERDRLAKEVAPLIGSNSQAAEKKQACQRYLGAIQRLDAGLDQKLQAARLPTGGNANMIGGIAVVKGVQNLAPACYDAMKAKEREIGAKENNFRQLCKQ